MCAIAGIYRFNSPVTDTDTSAVRRMLDAQKHRGPDGEGLEVLRPSTVDRRPSAVLGHRRLSIIDLSNSGRQPMCNEDSTVWLTYNGEIYNFRALRSELIKHGHRFLSQTDSEVLIHGYEQWGMDELLPRLKGMFAFALVDVKKDRAFFVKDRFGIKPLYYYQDAEKIVFASEVRALVAGGLVPNQRNEEALVRFLQLGSIPIPLTTLRDTYGLPAATYLAIEAGRSQLHEYWNLEEAFEPADASGDVGGTIKTLLEQSVREHLVSDVPLGVFLSGGIDSSALVALASRVREAPVTTVSVVFDEEEYSEAPYARKVAEHYRTDHKEFRVRREDFLEELPEIFAAMDQPTVDGVNTFFVSKAAKQAGLTVVLSGIGGDEVFLGYPHLKTAVKLDGTWNSFCSFPAWMRKPLLSTFMKAGTLAGKNGFTKLTYLQNPSADNLYLTFRGLFTPDQIQRLLGLTEKEMSAFGHSSPALPFPHSPTLSSGRPSAVGGHLPISARINSLEFQGYLQNQLLKDADAMSMTHSIETRVPFLDHELVEQLLAMPSSQKVNGKMNKPLLVNALGDNFAPEVWNRTKMGFTFPLAEWLKQDADRFEAETLEGQVFEKQAVSRVWEDFHQGRLHWSRPWALYVAGRRGQGDTVTRRMGDGENGRVGVRSGGQRSAVGGPREATR